MDIKAKIEEIVKKLSEDKSLLEKFQKDPAAAIQEITGLSIPKDQLEGVITAVKSKLSLDKAGEVLNTLGGLFGKK